MTVHRTASGNLSLMKKMALSLYKFLQPFEKKGTSLNMISVDGRCILRGCHEASAELVRQCHLEAGA